jgi:hypothetical protein
MAKPFTVLLPPNTPEIFFPAISEMIYYFSVNGMIRGRGAPPDYHGYLFHIMIGDRPILREIFRRLSEFLDDMNANINLLRLRYQRYNFSAIYPLDSAINKIEKRRSFSRKDEKRKGASLFEKVLYWSYHEDIELFFTD